MEQALSKYYVDEEGLTQDGRLYVRGVIERDGKLLLIEGL